MRWVLDLCFKTELRGVPLSEASPLDVTILLVTTPPFGMVTRVNFDSEFIRLRPRTDGEESPVRRHNAPNEDSYTSELNALATLPGFENLSADDFAASMERFQNHLTFVMKPHRTEPRYYRCSSLDSIYKGQNGYLYLPPLDPTQLLKRVTMKGETLPLTPQFYRLENDAMYLPLLIDLHEKGEEMHKDLSVKLISGGPNAMPDARAIVSMLREAPRFLPYLKGSVKQIAWASEIRESACNYLYKAGRRHGIKGLPVSSKLDSEEADRYVVSAENISDLLEELNFADEAKGWIDGRHNPFTWLNDRVALRARLGELGKFKPLQPLVITPWPEPEPENK